MTTPWHKNDELFFKELKSGWQWQEYVVTQLKEAGVDAEGDDDRSIRRSIKESHKYADQQDIKIITPKGNDVLVECKSRKISFTSPEDFPYDDIMIESISSYEGKIRKPDFYINVSQKTGAIIALSVATQKQWFIIETKDRTRNIRDKWFTCSTDLWIGFDELLEQLMLIDRISS